MPIKLIEFCDFQEEILATCRKNVECLENFLRVDSGDPKILTGEFTKHRHNNITFISFQHECNCMKLCRYVSASFGFIFKSKICTILLASFRNFFENLARAERTFRRFVGLWSCNYVRSAINIHFTSTFN